MRKHRAMKTIVIKKQDHHSSNRQTSDMLTARDPKDMSFILPLLNERRISIHRFLFNSILFRMYSKKETYVAFEPFCRNASVGSHLTRDNEAPDLEPGSGNTLRKYKPQIIFGVYAGVIYKNPVFSPPGAPKWAQGPRGSI